MAYIGNRPPAVSNLLADIKIGEDDETKIDFADANTINFHANNSKEMVLVENAFTPGTSDGIALGTTSLMWSDIFLASGAVMNFNNGNVTITHSSNTLTVAAATVAFTASTAVTVSNDLNLTSDAAVLNIGAGNDVTITHDNATGGTLSGTPMTIESLGASALADDDYTGIVLQFIAHEDLDVGQAVYIHTDDGEVGLADANALATMPAIGVVVGADASADAVVKVLTHGIYNDADGFGGALTEGATMYLGEAVGTVTATIPDADGDFVQVMGIACGPRDVFINPSLDIIERA